MAIESAIERPANSRTVDSRVYENELLPWLPERIIDLHVHVYLPEHVGPISAERRAERWPIEIASSHSYEDMRANFRMLFPKQEVYALVFGNVTRETYIERNNDYVLAGLSDPRNKAAGLFVPRPEWDPCVIENAMAAGFAGIKPYPDLSRQRSREVSIYDFAPPSHLATLDRLGGVMMLHLPRSGRLGDANNVRELQEIADAYPNIKLIVAHVGRAYCMPTVRRGLPHLVSRKNILFDITANVNPDVIEYALEMVGPDRLFYGSDLPVMLMRGVREHVGEDYVNYTSGPYSWNTNRRSPEEEAEYTFFVYEELRALIKAVKRLGLGKDIVESILYSNSSSLIGSALPCNGDLKA